MEPDNPYPRIDSLCITSKLRLDWLPEDSPFVRLFPYEELVTLNPNPSPTSWRKPTYQEICTLPIREIP